MDLFIFLKKVKHILLRMNRTYKMNSLFLNVHYIPVIYVLLFFVSYNQICLCNSAHSNK